MKLYYHPASTACRPIMLLAAADKIAIDFQPVDLFSGENYQPGGIVDHGVVHSIYFRDPNGYVIELTAKMPGHDEAMDPAVNGARAILAKWQRAKQNPHPDTSCHSSCSDRVRHRQHCRHRGG